jgi:dTMP kinase
LAYNCDSIEEFDFIQKLNDRFPNPDLTIYIDIPIEVSLARLQNRSLQEIYETKVKLTKVREQYQQIFSAYQGKAIAIDGTQDQQDIHQIIVAQVQALFQAKNA